MGVGDGIGVAVAVGIGVKVGGMGEGVIVGVGVDGAKTAVQDVRSTRVIQSVKRKIMGVGCWHIGAILPSESVLKIMAKTLKNENQNRQSPSRRFEKFNYVLRLNSVGRMLRLR